MKKMVALLLILVTLSLSALIFVSAGEKPDPKIITPVITQKL